jgi:hypothetical protein
MSRSSLNVNLSRGDKQIFPEREAICYVIDATD